MAVTPPCVKHALVWPDQHRQHPNSQSNQQRQQQDQAHQLINARVKFAHQIQGRRNRDAKRRLKLLRMTTSGIRSEDDNNTYIPDSKNELVVPTIATKMRKKKRLHSREQNDGHTPPHIVHDDGVATAFAFHDWSLCSAARARCRTV